jgi:hypothetical protein
MSIETLLNGQNRDGGWPYVRGGSWTEPTVYAILALAASGETEAAGRGLLWIRALQRPDGGWPPCAGVGRSTWVTALAALLPPESLGRERHARGIAWLLESTGKESTFLYRLREWLIGNPRPPEVDFPGWPWFPDTASWVGPTSLSILALEKEFRRHPSRRLAGRIESGRGFLLRRACHQGGWNHGSVQDLAYDSRPYPETTGMALAALRGVQSPRVDRALAVAAGFLGECRSADALNWLRLGLMAHGRLDAAYCPPEVAYRTLSDSSLDLLVAHARKGNGLFGGYA